MKLLPFPRLAASFLAGLSALLLSACLHLGEPKAVGPRPDRNTITAFSLEGRLSVRQAERSYQAGVQWTHGIGQENILLTGPLGQGLATLESSPEGARLTTADHKEITAPNADSLARDLLGFDLPLEALTDWALGRDHPVEGWQVTVLRYESDAADALPQLLELKKGDDLSVRLRIDEWQLQ